MIQSDANPAHLVVGGEAQGGGICRALAIRRKPDAPAPSRKIKAWYLSATYNSSDTGLLGENGQNTDAVQRKKILNYLFI